MQPQGGPGISSHHASGAHVLYADGHVQFLSNRTSPEVLESLATIDGGEKVSAREEEERRQAQETSRQRRMERAAPFTFALMVISGFILAFRPFPKRGEDAAPGSKQPNTPAPDGEEDE